MSAEGNLSKFLTKNIENVASHAGAAAPSCCHRLFGCFGCILSTIGFPIRFEDKGIRFLFWGIIFPAITFNIGFIFQNNLDWKWGLGQYIQNNSAFYEKMWINGAVTTDPDQVNKVTFGDIFVFSLLNMFGATGMFGTIALWIGFVAGIWRLHAPLKFFWKQFLIIFLSICVFGTLVSQLIVLGINPSSWTNYNISKQEVINQLPSYNAFLYGVAPWWFDAYWTYLNIVQGIVYGITQPILFYYYLIKTTQYETLSKQWYGFYDFYSKFYFCILYGVAIFIAQLVGIQGFTPAFFFIWLWYKKCYCAILCKTNKDIKYLKYNGDFKGDASDRGVYCCNCLPCIPCLACFIRPIINLEFAAGQLELHIAGEEEEAIKKLEDKLTRLIAFNDKHFGKKIGKVIDSIEEGLFDSIIEFISIDEKRHWWTYDLLLKMTKIRFGLPEENDPVPKRRDTKPYRLPADVEKKPAGPIPNVIDEMTNLLAKNQKIKAVGSGYAWTEILGTDVKDGCFIETMLANTEEEEAKDEEKRALFDFRIVDNENAMNGVLDPYPEKDLLYDRKTKSGQEKTWKEKYDGGYIICAEAGCSYYTLNEATWPCPKVDGWVNNGNINAVQRQTVWKDEDKGIKYKMLPNQPGYQGLSIGGTINVGVQGTGTQKTPEIVEDFGNDEEKTDDHGKRPVYKPDRSQAPGDFIRSLTMLVVNKESGKVEKWQIEPLSNPIHDPVKWEEKHGPNDDPECKFQLHQDDDLFYGSIISLGLIGIHVAYIFELIDASFEEEHRYIVTWDEFKSKHLDEINKGVESGEIIRWQLWLSPYTTPGIFKLSKFSHSPPCVVSTYRKTDKIPPKVLTATNAGSARTSLGAGITAGAAATWISQTIPELSKFILEMTLRSSVYGRTESEHYLAVDPYAAVALGASVLVPSIAVGNAVDYKDLVPSIEAWQKFGQDQFPKCPVTIPTAARFSCKSNQLLALANEGPTVWYESVTLDWSQSKWPHVGKVPNGEQHLFGVNTVFHDSGQFRGRYNWGLDFALKRNKANIWRYQQEQITEFVHKVYKRLTVENGPFANQFVIDSGIHAMAFEGKDIKELVTDIDSNTTETAKKEEETDD